VLITSAAPGEGKSRLAASLAASLARSGSRVLLVDADLHCPSLHTLFGAEPTMGLAEALAAGAPPEAYARGSNFSVIWAGNAGADSADLLASSRFDAMVREWRSQYDFVLLDSAPVLPVPDVARLAQLCDRTLLVVRYESTTLQAARRSYQMVRRNLPGQAELDVVMNGVPANSPDYFAYYGYKGFGYERTPRNA
jgi:capsular exopolysaccharide synthesis family protein